MSCVDTPKKSYVKIDGKENKQILRESYQYCEEMKNVPKVLQKNESNNKRGHKEVDNKENTQNQNIKRQKLDANVLQEADCIYLGKFCPKDKTKNNKEAKKDSKKTVLKLKKRMTPEEAKQKAEMQEKKRQESLLKKQELEARKLECERKRKEHRLLIDMENKAKEERKKERERRRLEKIEQQKEKEKQRAEDEKRRMRAFEAKVEKSRQMKEIKAEERRKKAEEKKQEQAELLKTWEAECKANYDKLAALDDENLVSNAEPFECSICFTNIASGEGIILHDCLHNFCRECLTGLIQHSETALVRCPFQNEVYMCESNLQDREIKSLVTPELYEKHLQRSMTLAESQAQNSFHCKTADCHGWCLYEDFVNIFMCPVCTKNNCLTCGAIHEGKTCKEYQDYVTANCNTNEEAMRTLEYLQSMVKSGEAMECPQCRIIIMKKYGCDFMICTMCRTDICWVTKGRRWGPMGQGDISGGCRCKVNGIPCHPNCRNCH